MLYDTCEDQVANGKAGESFGNFKLNLLTMLGIDVSITEDQFAKMSPDELTGIVHREALAQYESKNKAVAHKACRLSGIYLKPVELLSRTFWCRSLMALSRLAYLRP